MTIQEIDELIEEGNSLKVITQAYSEIANLKIKRIRSAVLRNRLFFDEISKIYGFVRAFATKKNVTIPKSKKRVDMLITSNYRFYGNINSSLINYFIGSTRELQDVDKIIIGKAASDYFRATKILEGTNYKEIILKDDMPNSFELADLSKTISQYNQVLVFYSKVKSLLSQRATFEDITATSFYTTAFHVASLTKKGTEAPMHFIFEPELPKILTFFDNQVLTLLLEQTFLESELSRTASRFISMDQAEMEANKFIKQYHSLKAHTQRSLENLKILENFATLMATKRRHHD